MIGDAGTQVTEAADPSLFGTSSADDRIGRWTAGQVAAGVVSVEAVALMVGGLSFRQIVAGALVVSGSWLGCSAAVPLVLRTPMTTTRLVVMSVGFQVSLLLGVVLHLTWWFPLVPTVLLAAAGRQRRLLVHASTWSRRVGMVAALALFVGTAPAYSLGLTLAQASTDPMSLRAVEWLRLRGGQGAVNGIEHWWYSHHAPPTGGAPDIPLIAAPLGSASATKATTNATTKPAIDGAGKTRNAASATGAATATKVSLSGVGAPVPVRPLVANPLPGEGQWTAMTGSADRPAIAVTRMRPDPVHTSVVVALARMDPTAVRFRLVAGTEDPGGAWAERGQVPATDRPNLLAVFNSGFRQREAGGGFWSAGRQAAPLLNGVASFVIRKDGTATVAQWGRDAAMEPDVAAVRQNLKLIVDAGAPVGGLDQGNNAAWGRTVGHRVLVWRSGIGVTKDGALIYAGGPGLSIQTLADVLSAAGSIRAMELDINSAWVAYFLFQHTATGPVGTKLLPGMRHAPTRYLSPQSRDFFEVLAR